MEHRLGRRQSARLRTKIYIENIPTIIATTRNISRHGVNLALTHPALGPQRMVRVVLSDPRGIHTWESRALVVYASDAQGTGLLLCEDMPGRLFESSEQQRGVQQGEAGARILQN